MEEIFKLENSVGKITIVTKEENGNHIRFVWSCGCITIMDNDQFTINPCSNGCKVIARGKQVADYYNISDVEVIPKYEKPLFELSDGMQFPTQIREKFETGSVFCSQCSGCHGCR